MASQFDGIRNRQRQGEEAKERVLKRLSGQAPGASDSPKPSAFDAVRNRTIDFEESAISPEAARNPDIGTPMAELQQKFGALTPRFLIDARIASELKRREEAQMYNPIKELEKLKAPIQPKPVEPKAAVTAPIGTPEFMLQTMNATRENLGFSKNFRISETEYEKRMRGLENAPPGIKQVGEAITKLAYGTPAGRFVMNALPSDPHVVKRESTGSKTADKVADVLNAVTTPLLTPTGAPVGTGPIAGSYGVADRLLMSPAGQRVEQAAANQLGKLVNPQTAQAVTREALRESAAGVMQGAAYGAMSNQDDQGILTSAALGGAIGGAAGAAFKAAGIGLSKLLKQNGIPENEISEILALPVGKKDARMAAAADRASLAAGTDPIANPYTFDLPEARPATVSAVKNAAEGRSALQEIDQAISDLQTRYEQRVIDEYKYLKESRDNRSGVQQGSLQRDAAGDVIGRTGRISENPLWYQEFHRVNGKVPSNRDLYELARKRVDEGFMDEAGQMPSWRAETGYDDELAGLMAVRENLQKNIKEIDPELRISDEPLVTERLKDTRPREPKPVRQSAAIEPEPVTEWPQVDPNAEPILQPGQFADQSGLGITPFAKVKPYDSLSNTTRSQLVTRLDREPVSFAGAADRLYTNLVDDLHPLNQFDKLVEDVLEKPLTAAESTHKLALSTRGADMTARQIITDAMVDSTGKVVGESLKDILAGLPRTVRGGVSSSTKSQIRKVSKDIYVDFEDYLINKHAITRAERGEKVFDDKLNWTPEYGAQKVAEYETMFPEFKETAEKLYEFNRQMVNSWLVDTGVISPEMAQAWFDANPFYVPNKRYFSPLEKRSGGVSRAKKGFGNQSNPVKGYQEGGSQRKIISPIEAMIENVDSFVKTAKRNQVMQQAVKHIQADPEAFADFVEIVKKPERLEDLTTIPLDGDGLDEVLSRFSDDFDKAMRRTALDKDNIVRVMVDGNQVHLKVNDPQLLDAITALGPRGSNAVMDAIGWLTNKMKTLTTGANPVFSLTRNIFRDIPHAYIASKTTNNPIRFVADLADAAVQILRDGDLYKQYKRIGGGHSSSIAANRNLLAQSKRSVFPKSLLKDLGPRLYYGLENAMNAVETAPRLGEFKRAVRMGKDLKSALYQAQDLTVNFKRRGKVIGELDKVFPYMNAAIQGLDQIVRLYRSNPVKATIKAFLALTVPGAIMYAVNRDDPNYQKMSNRVKDNFVLIPKGDGTFIRIAKPKELGTLFIDLPERLMRKFAEEDPAAFRDFADQLRTTFLPPGIQGAAKEGGFTDRMLGAVGDTIVGPFADLAANKTFSGSPIVPGYLERLSPGLQADAKTTNIARWIGEKTYGTPFEQSPKQLDYLVRQYTGVLGQFGQPLLSPGGDVGSSLLQQVTADPVFSNDISTEFYKYKEKLDQAYADRELKELPDWYSDPLRKRLNKISQNMSAVRKEIRAVQENKDMGNKEKREKLRDLQERINRMAESGNALAREVVPG